MALTMAELLRDNPGWTAETTSDGTYFRKGAWRFIARSPADAQDKIWIREPHRRPKTTTAVEPEPPSGEYQDGTVGRLIEHLADPGF